VPVVGSSVVGTVAQGSTVSSQSNDSADDAFDWAGDQARQSKISPVASMPSPALGDRRQGGAYRHRDFCTP
jgi:hypothetical protein